MVYLYKNTKIHYELIGEGDKHIVFLHGWGCNIQSLKFITNSLNFNYKALFIDFPPFGNSEEPKEMFTIFDYVNLTLQIIKNCKLNNYILVGHSFGGRVSTIIASENSSVNKLFLVDSAGMKPRRGIKYKVKILCNKIIKKFNPNINLGSKDYKSLSVIMKKTFINIVNTYLEEFANKINVPTIIFWGKQDKETPLYMAKRFNKLIKNSELVICKNAGHFSYIDDVNTFINVLNYFVND